jgi:hypothetical protein
MGGRQEGTVDLKDSRWLHAVMRLLETHPAASPQCVLRFLMEAYESVQLFGLSEREERERSEQIAQEMLAQWAGDSSGLGARLKPMRHHSRTPS